MAGVEGRPWDKQFYVKEKKVLDVYIVHVVGISGYVNKNSNRSKAMEWQERKSSVIERLRRLAL